MPLDSNGSLSTDAAALQATSIAAQLFYPAAVGQWYTNPLAPSERTLAPSLNALLLHLFWSGAAGLTIDEFDVNVSSGGTASLCRVGVYIPTNQANPFAWANGTAWGTKQVEAGTIATTGTTQQTLSPTAIVIAPNTWFAVGGAEQGTGAATRFVGGTSGAMSFSPFGTSAAGGYDTGPGLSLGQASVSGALPGTFTPNVAHAQNNDSGVGFHRSA